MDEADSRELYLALGLPKDATSDQIKESYYRLSRLFHPDRHTADQKAAAEEKFQIIQHAYEVLSDPSKKEIYDNFGEQGLKTDWNVGFPGKSAEELKNKIREQIQERDIHEIDSLVQSRSETTIVVNMTPLFARNIRVQNALGLGAGTRMLTPYERFSLIQWVSFQIKSSFSIPTSFSNDLKKPSFNSFSSGSFDDEFSAPSDEDEGNHKTSSRLSIVTEASMRQNSKLQPSIFAVYHSQPSPNLSSEIGFSLLRPGLITVKSVYAINNQTFIVPLIQISGLKRPPQATVVIGRQITRFGTLTARWKTGVWSLGSWGIASPRGANSSFSLTWQQMKAIPNSLVPQLSWNAEVTAGLMYSGIAYNYNLKNATEDSPYQIKLGTSMSTVGGLQVSGDTSRKVGRYSTFGVNISVGVPTGSITFSLNWSRLGQKISLPIMWCSVFDRSAVFWGLVFPITSILGVEQFFLRPRRLSNQKRLRLLRLQKLKDSQERKKISAIRAVKLMKEIVEKKQKLEMEKGGLVIEYAEYRVVNCGANEPDLKQDVTISIAALVENSRLAIPSSVSKSSIIGIYPLFSDNEKELEIVYTFHQQRHRVVLRDKQGVFLPSREHKILS
ncbi:DNAJC11 family DNAJ domain-containing protein [Schizosaccharomyces pombe]